MRKETIIMPYIGDLSVNHRLGKRKGGGYYVKQSVKNWNEEFGWKIKGLHIGEWRLPISVKCDGVFKDERSAPDLSNLSKTILDAIEDTCGVNDKNYRWYDGYRVINNKEKPYLLITIGENDD